MHSLKMKAFIYDSTNNMDVQYNSMLKLRNSVDIEVQYHSGLFDLVNMIQTPSSQYLLLNNSLLYSDVSLSIFNLMDSYSTFTNGDNQTGYSPIKDISPDIESLLLADTCVFTNNTSFSSGNWNSSFSLQQNIEFFQCKSIQELIGYINSMMEEFKEDTFRGLYSPEDFIDTFFKSHLQISIIFRTKMEEVLYVLVSIIDNIISLTVSYVVATTIIIVCCCINYIVFWLWKIFVKEMVQLRRMFNFISWETIESNELFMDYIMNFNLTQRKKGAAPRSQIEISS